MNFTDWFDGTQKPVRKGSYQRVGGTGQKFLSWWDCAQWYAFSCAPVDTIGHEPSPSQGLPWRGLADGMV